MNLAEIKAEVYSLTGRPDLVDRTAVAIRAATYKMHQVDFFTKDIVEQGIVFDSEEYIQSFDYKTVFPRWRALAYIRQCDTTTQEPLDPPLSVLTHDNLTDSYAVDKANVCYEAGQTLQIRTIELRQYFIVGYYANPDTSDATYSSWVAENYPYAIVYDAAATVFKSIGYDEQAREFRNLVTEQISMLRSGNIQAVGY